MWRTVDIGDGKPRHRFWCGACGLDWTAPISGLADRIASGSRARAPISTFCECGRPIRVLAFGGTLQIDDEPLRHEEITAPASKRGRGAAAFAPPPRGRPVAPAPPAAATTAG